MNKIALAVGLGVAPLVLFWWGMDGVSGSSERRAALLFASLLWCLDASLGRNLAGFNVRKWIGGE